MKVASINKCGRVRKVAVVICTFFVVICITSWTEAETYKFDRLWPTLQQPWYFNYPEGIAVDSKGFVYIVDRMNNCIQKFTSDGQFITKWGSLGSGDGEFSEPYGIATDNDGFVYVADTYNYRIQKFTSDGIFVTKWGSEGTGDGEFKSPVGIAVDYGMRVYVTDTNRIQVFTSDGQFKLKWGSAGNGNGELQMPEGLAIGPDGLVYVSDTGNNRVQVFTQLGAYQGQFGGGGGWPGQFSSPSGIAIDKLGYIYVVDSGNFRIQKFDQNWQFVIHWGTRGGGKGQFELPRGIAADASGLIYVAENYYSYIQKFTSDGDFITKWGSGGEGAGELRDPFSIAIDSSGDIYVSEYGNSRIQKFSPDGQYENLWGSQGNGDGEFNYPEGIAIDDNGYMYVADWSNYRIQKFNLNLNGQFETKWGSQGSGDGQFERPVDVAVDSNGFVYVLDSDLSGNSRVQKFTSTGQYVTKWGSYCDISFALCTDPDGTGPLEPGDGQFKWPSGIAVDSRDPMKVIVYVADSGNNRIQKFDSDGQFLKKWGIGGNEDGQFNYPWGIGVDDSGFVYVADSYNNRIQKFASDGQFVSKFGGYGSGPGKFNRPSDVTIRNDKLYITDQKNNRIQVIRQVSVSSNNKAIIVAGGGPYAGNKLWEATQTSANFAYWTLMYQGFPADRIQYLSSDKDKDLDLDGDGAADVDDYATNNKLRDAICGSACGGSGTGWASDAENLFVYLVDHGGSGTFRMSGTETLSASQLDSWLDALQATISGKVTVIYDACESGSFLSALTPPSGKERILVTSTSAGQQSYFVNQGSVSFSNFFWTNVFNGSTVKEAFDSAVSALTTAISNQTPQLQDGAGGALAQNTYIGNGTIIYGNMPTIGSVSSPQSISGTASATLAANNVTDSDGIARVWAVLLPPNYAQGASNNTVNGLPSIDLLPIPATNNYTATYDEFNLEGTYNIAIYAKDRIGNTSLPQTTTVTVGNPIRKRAIIVAGGSQTDVNWNGIQKGALAAYNALKFQGYTDTDIYFMSPVTFSSGIDGTSTLSNLSYAITTWAAGNTYDVVLYMVGNGDAGGFSINSTETLLADNDPSNNDLDSWLDTLQASITGKVTVVYDASYSGVFNAALAGPDRILIGSSGGQAYFLSEGDISFSNYFWKRILNGQNVRDAFYHASSAMEFSSDQKQKAQLDDNGNGISNESGDGAVAFNQTIGAGIKLAGNDPLIGSVVPPIYLAEGVTSALIWADNVTTTGTLDSVWAVVTTQESPGQPATQTTLPMSHVGNNRYEGTYSGFTGFGRYAVTVYAKDTDDNLSAVSETTVYQLGLIDNYEEDDTYQQANVIVLNNVSAQQHNFHDNGDVDWVKFYALADKPYTFSATNVGTNSDVVMELYQSDGTALIYNGNPVIWDNPGKGVDELHSFTFAQEGFYYLKVTNSDPNDFGYDTGYDLSVDVESGDIYFCQVDGIVTSSSTGLPVEGVAVQAGACASCTDTSDTATGYYYLLIVMNAPSEQKTMTGSKAGYNSYSESITVKSGVNQWKPVSMNPTNNPLVADFTGAPVSGTAPLAVTFTDSSTGGNTPFSYAWDFDNDGSTNSTSRYPSYTYNNKTAGDTYSPYTVTLTVTDSNGDQNSLTRTNYISVCYSNVNVVGSSTPYNSVQTAYNAASSGNTIQSRAVTIAGSINFSRNIAVTIRGGYDCNHSAITGKTVINGNMTISNGTVTMENVQVQ